ncbi:hypothetical protein [Beduinella massiliensis]|uniref:hypothetical protein n=1 Tax=Beduinella massiliensis TaxID=1852363 RepID=UPI000C85045C
MSASPSAARPSAFAPVRAAFAAFRARPLALLPALGACALAYVLEQAFNYPPTLIPDSSFLLQQAVRYALLVFSTLVDTAAALYVLRVFVRGERPGLSSLIEPLRWPTAYPRALFVHVFYPVIFLAVAILFTVLFSIFGKSAQMFLGSLLIFMISAVDVYWFNGSTVLLAVMRGKCRLRDFFVCPARSVGSLCAIFLCVDLLIVIVAFVPILPVILAAPTFDQATLQILALVQSTDALTPWTLVANILSILISLPRYAALGFLYERAVPAAASK